MIPDDHILKRVDEFLDLSWLCPRIQDLYDPEPSWSGIDPEAVVQLMLAGKLRGITHDRERGVRRLINSPTVTYCAS